MLVNQSFEIPSCDDAELNIKRKSKLEYRLTFDDEKELKALVFIIGGYGANASIYFLDSYRNYIAKNYAVVAIHVFYHCFCQRPSDEEKYSTLADFTAEDLSLLTKVLTKYKIPCDQLANITAVSHCEYLGEIMDELKMQGKLPYEFEERLSATYIPAHEEYQNFGLMAAIDHINALKHLVKIYPQFKNLPKIYGGGSYGGYLALLIAKIAPWYVDGIIDNSGAAMPPLNYILGRELKFESKDKSGDMYLQGNHFFVTCYLKTHWTRDENSPYFFDKANYLARALLNKEHLFLQSEKNKDIIFTSYHSKHDALTPFEFKNSYIELLKFLGYEVDFKAVDEAWVDGKFIKNLSHGCGIPDKALFRKELPPMLEKLERRKAVMSENSISYTCDDKIFIFEDRGDKFELHIKEKNGTSE